MTLDSNLTRLRAANPVPHPELADNPELFARITATEPGVRPSPRRTALARRPRVVVALALLAVALLATSALAFTDLFQGAIVKPPVTRAEYKHAQSQLVLPPGYHWPVLNVPSNSVTMRGGGGGHAVLIAKTDWECFWVDAIRSGDRSAQRRAHAELNSLMTNNVFEAPAGASEGWMPANPPRRPYAVFAHDGGLAWIKQGYRQAAAGQPARLEASCRANRPG
jgi:hypothetical protein